MKNFILKHKIILLIFLFLTLLFINKTVFATDNDIITYTDRFGKSRSIIAPPLDMSFGYIIKGNYLFVFNSSDAYCYGDGTDTSYASLYIPSGCCKMVTLSDNNTVVSSITDYNKTGRIGCLDEVLYTSVDIYKSENKSDVILSGSTNFFPQPPVETLLEVMKKVEKGAVLKEVMGLLPVILSVLVSLIALRKALKMLSAFLKTS